MSDRIAIVGAREASDETLEKVRALVRSLPEGTVVVSGGAEGVDTVARDEALQRGLRVVTYEPRDDGMVHVKHEVPFAEWLHAARYRVPSRAMRDTIIFRNTLIAIECDRMVAFVQGSKGGTWDALKQAERFKRPCEVIR
jgi:predicted Rossmann fold nucleotide-binding protein DprA/Smf involved in DNA uptake